MKKISAQKINLFLTVVVTFFLFAAGEFFLRLIYPAQIHPHQPHGWAIIPERTWVEYHPVLGWFHKKNARAFLQKDSMRIPVQTNSLGLRGAREYSLTKPSETIRIYAVGDSFTFGFGVKDEEVFTRQIELKNSSLEVLNLGVAGYGIDQIHLLLNEFGFDYQPDIVFVFIYPEDFWRATRAFNDAGYGKPYFKMMRDGHLQPMHSPVPRKKFFAVPQFPVFMEPSLCDRLFSWSRWYALSRKAWTRLQKKLGREDPDSTSEWILGRSILKESLALIKSKKVRPVLVMVPPQRWFLGSVEPINKSLARFAARENVDYLDLTPVIKKAMQETGNTIDFYYIPDDLHWTAAGHALVAKTILKYLQNSEHSP